MSDLRKTLIAFLDSKNRKPYFQVEVKLDLEQQEKNNQIWNNNTNTFNSSSLSEFSNAVTSTWKRAMLETIELDTNQIEYMKNQLGGLDSETFREKYHPPSMIDKLISLFRKK